MGQLEEAVHAWAVGDGARLGVRLAEQDLRFGLDDVVDAIGDAIGGVGDAIGAVESEVQDWLDNWANNEADIVSSTESADAYNQGMRDWAANNPGVAQQARIIPPEAECNVCQDLVDRFGDWTDIDDVLDGFTEQPHPRCVHVIESAGDEAPADVWSGYDESLAAGEVRLGDVPGHEFHGNRWTGGIGGGGKTGDSLMSGRWTGGLEVGDRKYSADEVHGIFGDQNLSRHEMEAFLEYQKLSGQGMADSKTINDALRNYIPLTGRAADVRDLMDEAIARNTLDATTLARGVDPAYTSLDPTKLQPGDIIHDRGYTSWAIPPHGVVRDFPISGRTGGWVSGMRTGQQHNPVVVLDLPSGTHGVRMNIETVLPHGSGFVVDHVVQADPEWWGRPSIYVKVAA